MEPGLNSALEPLVGRTVEEVRVSDDTVYFRCGTQWLCATVDGDCCSVSWVFTTTSYYLKSGARKEAALWVRSRELPSPSGDA